MYDTDPAFEPSVRRALIVLTVYGKNLPPRIYVIPYYPLPARVLRAEMEKTKFTAVVYDALTRLASNWKYDIVVGIRQ